MLLYNHSAEVWNNSLVLFGGVTCYKRSLAEQLSADVWLLELESLSLTKLRASTAEPAALTPRKCHSTALLGDELFVFGGLSDHEHLPLSDVWVFQLSILCSAETRIWRSVELVARESVLELGFFNHKMVLVPWASKFEELAGKVFMFGGLDYNYQLIEHPYRVDLDTFRAAFSPLDTRGSSPPPRHSHSMKFMHYFDGVVVSGGKGADDRVLGDLWIYSLVKRQWREVVHQSASVPRASHEVIHTQAGGRVRQRALPFRWLQ